MYRGRIKETIKRRLSLQSHWIIWSALIFFKIIGQATISVHNVVSKKRSKIALVFVSSRLGSCYNLILTLVMVGSNYIVVPAELQLADTVKWTGIVILLSTLGNLAVNTILVSYCVNQMILVGICNQLIDIEWELRRLLHPVKRGSTSPVLIVVYVLNGCLGLGNFCVEILFFQRGPVEWLGDIIPKIFVCWFIIQYFSAVSLVNAAFVDVNRALQDVSNNWSANFHPRSLRESRRVFVSSSSMQSIIQLRNLHERLCEVSIKISQFYSVPILPAITFCFFWLIYLLYNMIILFSLDMIHSQYWMFGYVILLIIYLMYPVFVLSNKITDTVAEIRRTGRVVHHLLNCAIDADSRSELKQFSLQLLHYTVEFTANGYFVIDNAFVNSMVGAVSTYLVILIQLDPFKAQQVLSLNDAPYNCSCDDPE